MRIALLIQCHKSPEQINVFLETMHHPAFIFFIHVDRKASIDDKILRRQDVVLLPNDMRIDVQWGRMSQVDATLNLLWYANSYGEFDFYWLCSGQDFPVKSPENMAKWFRDHPTNDFVELFESKSNGLGHGNNYDKRNELFFPHWLLGKGSWRRVFRRIYTEITGGYSRTFSWVRRKPVNRLPFYFGSSWVCLSKATWEWIDEFLRNYPEYYRFFEHCNCPDESFFQTLVMNSPFAKNRMDYLHYIDWSEGKHNPKVLTMHDIDRAVTSNKLMARKFDVSVDVSVIHWLQKKVHECHSEDDLPPNPCTSPRVS